jgi:hypothetical protein
MLAFGPERFRTKTTSGATATKAKRKAVDSQLMLDSETEKKWAEVVEIAAKESQSQLTC